VNEPAPAVPDAAGWDCHVHVFDATAPVAAGHYRPADRPLDAIESTAAAHGVHHLVLVQPSVYGGDNTLLLQALQRQPGRHRGVVVLPDAMDDATLDAMHAAGVRGVRLNLVSPVGEDTVGLENRFRQLAPRLRHRGWHLQWYAAPAQLALIARLHAGSGVVAVLDHLAGLHATLPVDDPTWAAAMALADGGAWVKLSGWYRLGATEPYDTLQTPIRRVAGLFGPRCVWGSDWPHTHFAPDAMPGYASTWAPVVAALGVPAARVLRQGAARLYA
jgi:predicted TIM-barrel fold metal-dependent hydrolase